MSGGSVFLDDFFSHPAQPYNPATNNARQNQQQTQLNNNNNNNNNNQTQLNNNNNNNNNQQLQQTQIINPQNAPHTPSSTSQDATSASSSSQGGERSSGVNNNNNINPNNNNNNNNNNINNNNTGGYSRMQNYSPNSGATSTYAAMTHSLPHHHQNNNNNINNNINNNNKMQPPMMMMIGGNGGGNNMSNTIPLKSNEFNTNEISQLSQLQLQQLQQTSNVMRGQDAMLERLMTSLGECKGMATLQLQLAKVTTPTSPAVEVLHLISLHLEEDIRRLLQLRDVFTSSVSNININNNNNNNNNNMAASPASVGQYHHASMMNDITRDNITTSLSQLQSNQNQNQQYQNQNQQYQNQNQQYHYQQNQQQMDVNGSPLFGPSVVSTTTAPPFYDRGIWCPPEARVAHNNNINKNNNNNNNMELMEVSDNSAAVTMQNQQQYQYQQNQIDNVMPVSGQMLPYMNNTDNINNINNNNNNINSTGVSTSTTPAIPTMYQTHEDPSLLMYATGNTPTLIDNHLTRNNDIIMRASQQQLQLQLQQQQQQQHQGEDEDEDDENEMIMNNKNNNNINNINNNNNNNNNIECAEVDKFLAFVEFKRHRVRKYECNIDISPGQYVIVDGDRGRDCGLLVQTIKTQPDGTNSFHCMDGTHINSDKIKLEKGRVLGLATSKEIDHLHHIMQQAERVALETCKKVCKNLGIHINLLDCEYQFDMEKVSFYFNSEHSVDFRPLVRELYRTFRVRIWMENTNPHVKNAMPASENENNENNNNNNNNDDTSSGHNNNNNNNNNNRNESNSGSGNGGKKRGTRWSTQKQTHGRDERK